MLSLSCSGESHKHFPLFLQSFTFHVGKSFFWWADLPVLFYIAFLHADECVSRYFSLLLTFHFPSWSLKTWTQWVHLLVHTIKYSHTGVTSHQSSWCTQWLGCKFIFPLDSSNSHFDTSSDTQLSIHFTHNFDAFSLTSEPGCFGDSGHSYPKTKPQVFLTGLSMNLFRDSKKGCAYSTSQWGCQNLCVGELHP